MLSHPTLGAREQEIPLLKTRGLRWLRLRSATVVGAHSRAPRHKPCFLPYKGGGRGFRQGAEVGGMNAAFIPLLKTTGVFPFPP